jgi:hypothetical protein
MAMRGLFSRPGAARQGCIPAAGNKLQRSVLVIFYFFSSRLFDNDFRRPLIETLAAKGYEAWHVRIGKQIVLTGPDFERREFNSILGLVTLIKHVRAHLKIKKGCPVFVDTTGAFLPARSLLLRASLRGVWCFDIFDNLLYNLRSVFRLKRQLEISLLSRLSSINIVLSQETLRLFPQAHHLDNAAHTRPIARSKDAFIDLVCLFMIDHRFDFKLVAGVAALAPHLKIFLYGRLGADDQAIKSRLEELRASYPNVIYRGEYGFDDVDTILAPFGIGFTPYVIDNLLTEYINPDKYYLYLNSGMEVISTNIPQARRMADYVHIAGSAAEIIELAERIKRDPTYRKNNSVGRDFTWNQRAEELIEIIKSHASRRIDQPLTEGHQSNVFRS